MSMTSIHHHIALAKGLPPRLLRFFARYPPPAILPPASPTSSASEIQAPIPNIQEVQPSPFKAHKSPITGKWHNPKFSLRRQAELVKLARKHGVEELLPQSVKSTAERIRRREENGLRVRGTGIGQKVKGKAWERTLKGRYVHRYLGQSGAN
jgi:large subunit ribosomal protein L25